MNDEDIILLYWNRNERAIKETERSYGRLLSGAAYRILGNREDTEEAVNDTYLRVWNSIPEDRPQCFSAYLVKVTRGISIDLLRKNRAKKRGGSEYLVSLDELAECITSGAEPQTQAEKTELKNTIEAYLRGLPDIHRTIFIQRYFFAYPVKKIAQYCNLSESNIKTILFRLRQDLRVYLEQEGY